MAHIQIVQHGNVPPKQPNHEVIKVKRFYYVHILDNNTNVSRCVVGPRVFSKREHESCLFDPKPCISVPPRHYCVIKNPHCTEVGKSEPLVDPCGQVKLHMGSKAIRNATSVPFPLYPGEALVTDDEFPTGVRPLKMLEANEGYHLRCLSDFTRDDGVHMKAGMEWCQEGPGLYIPHVEVEVIRRVVSEVISPNTALLLRAKVNFVDRKGVSRRAGELWLIRDVGSFTPGTEEEVVEKRIGIVLGTECAIHLRALLDFTDVYGVSRRAGDLWLVTQDAASVHVVDVHEDLVDTISPIVLSSHEYAIVLDPRVEGETINRYGHRIVKKGEDRFFLQPEEKLLGGEVKTVAVASKDEALLLKALDTFTEPDGTVRIAGSKWMLKGPVEYVPDKAVEIIEKRSTIALDVNEGVYVMNTRTGEVRAVIGTPYMPNEHEVLWNKELTPMVKELLARPHGTSQRGGQRANNSKTVHSMRRNMGSAADDAAATADPAEEEREKYRVVRFHVQHNAAVQVNDYQKKESRVVIGPDLVILAPHEEITMLSLSGGTPKTPNAIHSLELLLGPRFTSDTIEVETSDHARLRLRLSYNWYFDRTKETHKFFCVPDFVGDCCKTIASRVRGAVAGEDFDSFHRNSADIIQRAVFGVNPTTGEIEKRLVFPANNFIVTNIDIQSVEPTDEKTRDSLQKSVQLAIEITTKSQEAAARHGNELKDQKAKGQLERQKLKDKIEVEQAKTQWLQLQAESDAIQASGQSVAEAKAKAEALRIQVESDYNQAVLRAKAYILSAESELKKLEARQELELLYLKNQQELELEKAKQTAEAEADKVKRMVEAIGRDTLVSIARAGPEMQAKLLGSLGLKGYLLSDGRSPINLFNTAQGMLASVNSGDGIVKPPTATPPS